MAFPFGPGLSRMARHPPRCYQWIPTSFGSRFPSWFCWLSRPPGPPSYRSSAFGRTLSHDSFKSALFSVIPQGEGYSYSSFRSTVVVAPLYMPYYMLVPSQRLFDIIHAVMATVCSGIVFCPALSHNHDALGSYRSVQHPVLTKIVDVVPHHSQWPSTGGTVSIVSWHKCS